MHWRKSNNDSGYMSPKVFAGEPSEFVPKMDRSEITNK